MVIGSASSTQLLLLIFGLRGIVVVGGCSAVVVLAGLGSVQVALKIVFVAETETPNISAHLDFSSVFRFLFASKRKSVQACQICVSDEKV